ncbi:MULTISPECIES: hypothetical protein [unclassified Rathayibacter]|uniref:hypothetical protein n=1 Tax=unclassified Rathayibacter TaxID=2609250 RepID=UPI00104B9A71|nr:MULTISPECIES: hypothetical protein [unclassified Rathayibacter]MCJ1703391.1 hypothetical protein [Rathayibacter sp. VKM Ac-2926]TCL80446.1 hypothetical protein EDF49_109167 [Rathayibacter sp. PhB192]TCM25972.1 hypothetical protein EDF43_109167 [Rathayibacter sp. PhB179]
MLTQTATRPVPVDNDDESYREPLHFAALAAEYALLAAVAAEIKERQESIAKQRRDGHGFGTHETGNLMVAIQYNRRPNMAAIEKDYPTD